MKAQRVFINSAGLLFFRLAAGILAIFASIVLVKYLGPASYGKFAIAGTFFVLFQSFTNIGIESIMIKEMLQDPERAELISGNGILIRLLAAFISMLLMALSASLYGLERDAFGYVLVASIGLLFGFSSVYAAVFQARNRILSSGLPEIVLSALSYAAILLATRLKADVLFFVALQAGILGLTALLYVVMTEVNLRFRPRMKVDFSVWRLLLVQSWPLFLTSLFMIINLRADQFLLYRLLGPSDMGIYSSAVKLVEGLHIVPVTFATVMFPLFCSSYSESREKFENLYTRSFKYMAILVFPIALLTTVFAGPIISGLFGDSFSRGSDAMRILIWSEVFVFLGALDGQVLLVAGLQRYIFLFNVLGAVSNVILNLLLIPSFGIAGCAAATVISYGIVGIVPQLVIPSTRRIMMHYLQALLIPALASLPAGVILFVVSHFSPIAAIPASCLAYVLALYFMGGIDAVDMIYVKEIIDVRMKPREGGR